MKQTVKMIWGYFIKVSPKAIPTVLVDAPIEEYARYTRTRGYRSVCRAIKPFTITTIDNGVKIKKSYRKGHFVSYRHI